MLKNKKWLIIAFITIIVEFIFVAVAAYHIAGLDMLPDKYLYPVIILLFALVILTAFLLFFGLGKKKSKGRKVRRIIAIILAAVLSIVSLYVTMVTAKVDQTVDEVTDDDRTVSAMMGVYVQKEDSAEEISDCKDYVFGVMSDFDIENTKNATDAISKEIGSTISTTGEASVADSAAALFDGSVNALILNEAYAGVLADTDDYSDFSDRTKIIYEIPIETEDTSSEEKEKKPDVAITDRPFALYLSGSDTRNKMLTTSRSDVNIVMVVNPKTKQILLLNTPRDYYVPNPAGGGTKDKLTHCGIYGVNNSIKALENLYDVDIDYYMQINFTGFEKLIDAIGGITVDVPKGFTNINGGNYTFTTGKNKMDGKKALAFARERFALSSGDNERGQNQMRVIEATISKLSSSGTALLTNYSDILDSLQGMFNTDMPSSDISALIKMQLDDGATWNVKKYAVKGNGGSEYTFTMPHARAYVMYPDETMVKKAAGLVDKVENGDVLTDEDVEE